MVASLPLGRFLNSLGAHSTAQWIDDGTLAEGLNGAPTCYRVKLK